MGYKVPRRYRPLPNSQFVMQFIQRLRLPWRSKQAAARTIRAATLYLMRHVGMTGRVQCLLSEDGRGRSGYVLRLSTLQRIPRESREEIRQFFCRKLNELGELKGAPLLLHIEDADDLAAASHVGRNISSARVASVVAASNKPMTHEAASSNFLQDVRRSLRERREARGRSDYAPLRPAALTDLGALPSA